MRAIFLCSVAFWKGQGISCQKRCRPQVPFDFHASPPSPSASSPFGSSFGAAFGTDALGFMRDAADAETGLSPLAREFCAFLVRASGLQSRLESFMREECHQFQARKTRRNHEHVSLIFFWGGGGGLTRRFGHIAGDVG